MPGKCLLNKLNISFIDLAQRKLLQRLVKLLGVDGCQLTCADVAHQPLQVVIQRVLGPAGMVIEDQRGIAANEDVGGDGASADAAADGSGGGDAAG